MIETLNARGDNPSARFGHTINLVSKSKAILFGGATGKNSNYFFH
jgi:protein phosphatase